MKATTEVDVYEDQTNVTVTIETDKNEWIVQTTKEGVYSQMRGCEITLNNECDDDFSDHSEYEAVIKLANKTAQDTLAEIGGSE